MAMDEGDDSRHEAGEDEADGDEEPHRAGDDLVGFGGGLAHVVYFLGDFVDADVGNTGDVASDRPGGARHDDFVNGADFVFGGKDVVAGEGILDGDGDVSGFVDVAVVLDSGGGDNRHGENKAGEVIFEDASLPIYLAGNLGVDNTGDFVDVTD